MSSNILNSDHIITKIAIKSGSRSIPDERLSVCPHFQNLFQGVPTSQNSFSLALKKDNFFFDDASLVDSKLIHLSQLIELNTELRNFRKEFLFLIFSNYTDNRGSTNKNFTILPPPVAKQLFSHDWLEHAKESFKALLDENCQRLTAQFSNTPISKSIGFLNLVPELKIKFSVESLSQLEIRESELSNTDTSEKFKVGTVFKCFEGGG